MNEWSRYMGTPPNTIERSHNRNVLVNFHMLFVNLTIKYFNDMIVVKSIEFNVITLFKNLPYYIDVGNRVSFTLFKNEYACNFQFLIILL